MKRTKMLCAITSVLMAVLLIALSVSAPIGALDTLTASNEDKIDSVLKEKMAEASENEKIPVAIWYSDVDQDNIDKLTAQKVGFTQDDVAVAYEMPSTELLASLDKEEAGAKDEMQAYLKRTESLRKLERERTEEYIMTRREFSREKYNEKSTKLIKGVDIKSEDITFQSQYAPMIFAELNKEQINSIIGNGETEKIYYNVYDEQCIDDEDSVSDSVANIFDSIQIAKDTINYDDTISHFSSDEYVLDGSGVTIGVSENGGMLQECDEINASSVESISGVFLYEQTPHHATNVTRLIVGTNSGFAKGAHVINANTTAYHIDIN